MIKIKIVEDDVVASDTLKEYLKKYASENNLSFKIDVFNNAVSFLSNYDHEADLVFMDIEMEYMNGMDAAKKLRTFDENIIIIFVTNMAQFAIKGYEVDALDFIVKPVKYFDFSFRLEKAIRKIKNNQKSYISINTTGQGFIKIDVSKIKYIEVLGHDITYYLDDAIYQSYGTLKKIEKDLPSNKFARCNSCYLINLKYVESIKEYTVNVGGKELKISQPKKKEFMKALNNYINGEIDV